DEAANRIRTEVDPDANIIIGSTLDPEMAGAMRVSVVATGIDAEPRADVRPDTVRRTTPAEGPVAVPPAPAPAEPAPAAVMEADDAPQEDANTVAEEAIRAFVPPRDPQRAPQHEEAPAAAPTAQTALPEPAMRRGEPTPETLRRLQAAVNKMPGDQIGHAGPRQHPLGTGQDDPDNRGALNRLIHRMTGQATPQTSPARSVDPRESRTTPELERPQADGLNEDEQARIDVPAFLRRQAN
ncbi:MAG: cell division protein FtsZ, partial [Pseudomonadota bacterium]